MCLALEIMKYIIEVQTSRTAIPRLSLTTEDFWMFLIGKYSKNSLKYLQVIETTSWPVPFCLIYHHSIINVVFLSFLFNFSLPNNPHRSTNIATPCPPLWSLMPILGVLLLRTWWIPVRHLDESLFVRFLCWWEASRDQKWAKFLGWLSSRSLGAENWKWKVNAAWDLEGFVLKEMAIWRQCRWWVWNLHISRLQGISKSSSTANQLQYSDCILMLVMLPYPETNVLPDRCDDIMSCQDTYWMGHDLSFCQW